MNSEGASDSGAISTSISTPSSVSFWPVFSANIVGSASVMVPTEVVLPRPPSTMPVARRGSSEPYI